MQCLRKDTRKPNNNFRWVGKITNLEFYSVVWVFLITTTRIPLGDLSSYLIFEYFSTICGGKSSSFENWQECCLIYKRNTCIYRNTGRFIMFSAITNIYNKKSKGRTLMELFTATGKLNFSLTTRGVRCVLHGWHGTRGAHIENL